jgi:hypothetical protein
MTDDEWAIVEPFLTTLGSRGGRQPANHRRMLDGVFWITRMARPGGGVRASGIRSGDCSAAGVSLAYGM